MRIKFKTRAARDRGTVLHTLLHVGDQLTGDVIADRAGQSPRRARRALRTLRYLGMVEATRDGTAWEITDRGREVAAPQPSTAV